MENQVKTNTLSENMGLHEEKDGWFRPDPKKKPPMRRKPKPTKKYTKASIAMIWVAAIILTTASWLFAIFGTAFITAEDQSFIPSTIQRTKLTTTDVYMNDCVVDEIGWINDTEKLSENLKYFFEKTGCQPFIYLKAYDDSLITDQDYNSWAAKYYSENFAENQNVVLYVYFADQENDRYGYNAMRYGTESAEVMDSEAEQIFRSYLYYDWDNWDQTDNDGMFTDIFTKSADKIMTVSSNTQKTAFIAAIIVTIITIVAGIGLTVRIMFEKQRTKTQKAMDALNASMETQDTTEQPQQTATGEKNGEV